MQSLPLFHRIAGQPVVVLGEGAAAMPKRRLVERAGGLVISDIDEGIDRGARLAFIAYEDDARCEAAMARLRGAGMLVNVVDKPDWCDFTTPSILERDPVLLAIGTSGASAGLAKHLRLRLEELLPQSLGLLASRLQAARDIIRARFTTPAARRAALDLALAQGGMLDVLEPGSANRIDGWLQAAQDPPRAVTSQILLAGDDPEDLTLRAARLLGQADLVLFEAGVPETILNRARADARRLPLEAGAIALDAGLTVILRRQ